MENVKSLWEMLQEIVEKEEKRFSLHEFLLESTDEERKEIEDKLVDYDFKQFYEYMDGFTFVNRSEVNMAICDYMEKINARPLCIWEMVDVWELADEYIDNRKLKLEDEEELPL